MSITAAELTNYKLQLKKVEEAITLDPDNEELRSLVVDLKEARQSFKTFLFFLFFFFCQVDCGFMPDQELLATEGFVCG